jgi:hypothetical protein
MTQHANDQLSSQTGGYNPQSHDRRRGSRSTDDGPTTARAWWRRPSEIIAACALFAILASTASAFGVHFLPATRAVEAEAAVRQQADTALQRKIDRNSERIDTVSTQVKDIADRLLFMNFLQCMASRQNNGGALPENVRKPCTDIIQKRLSP